MNRNAIIALAAVAAFSLAGCGGGKSSSSETTSSGSNGTITIAGSTALLPLVKQAAADYQGKKAAAKISVSGGGSRVGVTQAAQKGVDIGDSDIPAPDQPSLVDHQVAVVTFGVVVNPKSNVKNLTKAQIHDIFISKTKNFKDVGGADQTITIINRPRSSGTRAVFVQKIMNGTQPSDSGLTQDSSGTVATMVGQTPGAISYLAMSYVKPDQQTAVSIDGVAPTVSNVVSGKYPFWSYEHMLTFGQPRKEVNDFIVYVTKDTALLKQLGFIPVSDMKVK
ncbi:MAG: phosphate ABC transporter substrate-binding protein [Candidatus Eremiobacteraeota bacterium]|nr:phosphate ABC transporter substrate-binding protein [Candidatus Eremiobacteraeota bacterium]